VPPVTPVPRGAHAGTRLARAVVVLALGLFSLLALAGPALAQSSTPAPPPSSAATPTSGAASTSTPPADGISVKGTLRNAAGVIAGAQVQAADSGGAVVATSTTGDRGTWELVVSPGTYTFSVVESSLPDGVSVQGTVSRSIVQGQLSTVVFSFGEVRSSTEIPFAERFLRVAVDGLRFGLVIAITAVGLSLIYGTTGLTNFAHGELVTIGAVVAWVVNVKFGVQLIPATIIAIVVGIGVGMLNDLAVWRPLRRRRSGLIAQLVVSIGLSIGIRYLILILFGGRSQAFTDYQSQVQHDYGPIQLTDVNLATMVISLVVLIGVALVLQRTRIGKAMRAVADNRDLAASSGINVERVVLFVWALGGGLASLGGVLFALSELAGTVQWEMGFKLLLLMFAGITLGGLGTAYGALLGCVIVGLIVQLSTLVIDPDLKYTGGLLVLIVILVLRPQGILGSRSRIG
jgi:neutral amino acid transport system permease protein